MSKVRNYKGKLGVYGGNFVIKVSDSIEDAMKSVPNYEFKPGDADGVKACFFIDTEAKTSNNRCYYLFFTPNPTIAEIVHECIHWKNEVFSYHGVKVDFDNDEHEAYFIDYLVNHIVKLLYPDFKQLYKK